MSPRTIAITLLSVLAIVVGGLAAADSAPGVRHADLPVPTSAGAAPIATTDAQLVAQARALTDAGYGGEADALVKAWAKQHPGFDAPADLRSSASAAPPAQRWLNAVLPWVVGAGLVLAALIAIFWLARLVVELAERLGGFGLRAFAGKQSAVRLTAVDGTLDQPTRDSLGSLLIEHSERLSERVHGAPRGARV